MSAVVDPPAAVERTERDVVAETIAVLIHRNVVGVAQMALAERVCGLPSNMVHETCVRLARFGWPPLLLDRPVASWRPPAGTAGQGQALSEAQILAAVRSATVGRHDVQVPDEAFQRRSSAQRQRPSWLAKNPEPGLRVCCVCDETLPVEQFSVKKPATGQLHAMCIACRDEYQRFVRLQAAVDRIRAGDDR